MKKYNYLLLYLLLPFTALQAQQLQVLNSGHPSSLRGLSVVNDQIVWVSGSNGTVGLSLDGGNSWEWMQVKGFEQTDFRDIEAFSSTEAILMAVGEPAYILKTVNAGKNWKIVFKDDRKGMFLDAMEFWNELSGIVVGDPVNGKIFIARTFDGGETWRGLPEQNYPQADSGEALFAASGTNIRALNKQEAVFITGGSKARLFIRDKKIDLPLVHGKPSTGAFSLAINNKKDMIVVGGDYVNDTAKNNNCYLKSWKQKKWLAPQNPPNGFRSCVEYITRNKVICCGTSGVDYSNDGGKNWFPLSTESFHVVRKAKKGNAVFLAGANGRIARLKNK